MRILFLTAYASINGRGYLKSRSFLAQAKAEHDVLVRHCWVEDRSQFADKPAYQDITDTAELSAFDPEVIISEHGVLAVPGQLRLPEVYLQEFFQRGGILIAEGLSRSALTSMRPDDRELVLRLLHTTLFDWRGPKSGIPYILDLTPGRKEGHTLVSDVGELGMPSWLSNIGHLGERIAVLGAVAVEPILGGEYLAFAPSTSTTLISDLFKDNPLPAWATVAKAHQGYVVCLGGTVLHDLVADEYPDNVRWVLRLATHLHDDARREQGFFDHSRVPSPSTEKLDIATLAGMEEDLHLEHKETALATKEMQDEAAIAISAFANADGGTLLIGVTDARMVVGIDQEIAAAKGVDAYIRRLDDAIGSRLDPTPTGKQVQITVHQVAGRQIASVRVQASARPVWCQPKSDATQNLWVRKNNRSQKLTPKEAVQFAKP